MAAAIPVRDAMLLAPADSRAILQRMSRRHGNADTLALLPRFSLPLCEHLLEGRGSELLGELQRRQLFVRSLDSSGTWFRLWQPLAEVLRRLPGAPVPASIHVRACQWFASRGEMRDAWCAAQDRASRRLLIAATCGMLWVRAPSVSYADALSNNSKLEN